MRAHEELKDPSAELDQLRRAMETLPVIEQAKGMFMLLRGWSADQAFTALKTISQHTNVKLHHVATVIVAAGSHVEPSPARSRGGAGRADRDPKIRTGLILRRIRITSRRTQHWTGGTRAPLSSEQRPVPVGVQSRARQTNQPTSPPRKRDQLSARQPRQEDR
ncbi:ANTAR domain-containing protein [Amycolatopsis sp. cmx-4-54]|uniref:ANTAR domain-containing protein n=1 Tax=Amycolatopsis sp. cmx-4-54 TaxID=2790936 RepID=UPI0039789E85